MLYQITIIRIAINDFLFVIFGFILSGYLFKLARLSLNYILPEQSVIFHLLYIIIIFLSAFNDVFLFKKNISIMKAIIVSLLTSFCLITRTVYNVLSINAVSLKLPNFNFDWIDVSDQADLVNLTETKKFISFFCVLGIWELIPSFVIICLFRLRRSETRSVMNVHASNSFAQKSVFLESDTYTENNNEQHENYTDEQRRLLNDNINYGRSFENSYSYNYKSVNA